MNIITEKLTSLQVERHFLSALVKYPDLMYEVDSFLKSEDFANNLHGVLYSIARQEILAGNTFDKVILAQKLKSVSISTKDDVNPFDYISNLYDSQINIRGGLNAAKELVKLRLRRDIYNDAKDVQSFITGTKCSDKTLAEIVSEVDGIYNKRINTITTDDEPIDLFAGIEDYIKDLASKPDEEPGLITPFSQYNKWFGPMRAGAGSYVFSARLSEGKSVLMFNLAKGIAAINNCKVLYMDTEMDESLTMERAAAAEIGMNPYWLQKGRWTKNYDLSQKVLKAFPEFKKLNGLFYYVRVAGKGIKEILSLARKWKLKHVGRDEKAFVVLDYLKISGENTSDSRSEWQVFGDWTSYINDFGLNYNAVTGIAAQQNRNAVQNGQRYDSDVTIGGSDRIAQYARLAAIIRRKTFDEISEHGEQFGTHMLVPVKYARDQGEEDYLNHGMVKIPKGDGKSKVAPNYLNLTMHNYHVKEAGTYKDVIEHLNRTKSLDDKKDKDKSTDL